MFSKHVKFRDHKLKIVHSDSIGTDDINNHYIDVTDVIKEGVTCYTCNKLHVVPHIDKEVNFITIYGTILVNDGGGILGNGDWDTHGVHAYHFCPECLKDFIDKTVGRKMD